MFFQGTPDKYNGGSASSDTKMTCDMSLSE